MFIANRVRYSQKSLKTPTQPSSTTKDLHLQQVLSQLKRNNQTKDLLLTKIGHELLTPLNGIIGSLELARENLDDIPAALIETALKSAGGLHQLIEDIVDLSQLTRGEIRLQKENFCIKESLGDLILHFAQVARRKGLEWNQNIDIDEALKINGDGSRLQQILRSLINNAIKFTETGTISLSIETSIENKRLMLFRATVEDTGIGIKEAEQVHIFNSFYQVEDFCNRNHQGSGVGLSLAYLLIKQMGGEISVQSTPKKGSRFEIFIPFPIAKQTRRAHLEERNTIQSHHERTQSPKKNTITVPSDTHLNEVLSSNNQYSETHSTIRDRQPIKGIKGLENAHVLIVEDNAVNQMVLKGLLTRAGITSQVAANGEIALKILNDSCFDTILMDCQMPILDGYATTRAIRRLASPSSATPIIAITANITEKDKDKCIKAGMNDFLTKPIQADILYSALLKWLQRDSATNSPSQQLT